MPTIVNNAVPGGQLFANEAALASGSAPGSAPISSTWSFIVSADRGIGALTVAGYAAIQDGVFTPGGADLGFGRVDVISFDASTGRVGVDFVLTGAYQNAPGGPARYGDLISQPIVLTDNAGASTTSALMIQIRDDDGIRATDNSADASPGSTLHGNLLLDGAPDTLGADGAGVVRITGPHGGAGDDSFDSSGQLLAQGDFGQLLVQSSGAYAYAADSGAPAGAVDHFLYTIRDGDGDQASASLRITLAPPAARELAAAPGGDSLQGGAGADTLEGASGDDYLRGNDGNDSITGGAGFDDINGNRGNDTASGGEGNDWVVGGQDDDLLNGDAGNDIVYGNLGNDTAHGGDGDDWVRGGQGDDVIYGDAGNDFMSGDRGNDTIYGGAGADRFNLVAGAGIDRVMDFDSAEGDRVSIEGNLPYTLSFSGGDAVVSLDDGSQMILVGVANADTLGVWR